MSAVVFDIGGVIVTEFPDLKLVASLLEVPFDDRIQTVVWHHRRAFDLGLSDGEYWTRVAADLGTTVRADQIAALVAADVDRWRRNDRDTIALIQELRDFGHRMVVLSNAPTSQARGFESLPWVAASFHELFFSCDEGLAKPDPEIFQSVTKRLGIAGSDTVFFDDIRENVAAAKAEGWVGHLWAGPASARTFLAESGWLG